MAVQKKRKDGHKSAVGSGIVLRVAVRFDDPTLKRRWSNSKVLHILEIQVKLSSN